MVLLIVERIYDVSPYAMKNSSTVNKENGKEQGTWNMNSPDPPPVNKVVKEVGGQSWWKCGEIL